MKIEYFPEADSLYLRLNEGPADDDVVVDTRGSKIIGIEIVDVSRHADVQQFEPYLTYSSREVMEKFERAAAAR
jgi:uncharacterized protein YuzE